MRQSVYQRWRWAVYNRHPKEFVDSTQGGGLIKGLHPECKQRVGKSFGLRGLSPARGTLRLYRPTGPGLALLRSELGHHASPGASVWEGSVGPTGGSSSGERLTTEAFGTTGPNPCMNSCEGRTGPSSTSRHMGGAYSPFGPVWLTTHTHARALREHQDPAS